LNVKKYQWTNFAYITFIFIFASNILLASSIVFYSISNKSNTYWEILWEHIERSEFNTIDDVYFFFIDFLPKLW